VNERRSLLVAGLQTAGIPNDLEGTVGEFEQRVRSLDLMLNGVQLVVAPELHLMALPPMLDAMDGTVEDRAVEIPGPLTERLCALARETGLWLVPGSLHERADEGVYNTAVVLSPTGELVATYRKCFPWQPYEKSLPGHEVVGFEIEGAGRLGLAICHDGVFPEVFRQLTWDGAEAILQVSLTSTSDRDAEIVVARANAIVNQVYIVNVNAASPVGNGRSVVVDPEGIVRYEAGAGEDVITTVVDFDAVALVRERGSFGLNRLLEQLDRQGAELDLPMYGGRYRPRPGKR
jgi:formamidase